MNIGAWVRAQSKTKIYVLAVLIFLLDEYIDYITGPEVNISFLHLVPLYLIVWNSGFIASMGYSFFCTLVLQKLDAEIESKKAMKILEKLVV